MKIKCYLIPIIMLSFSAAAQDSLTVEEAVRRVIENHPAVIQARQQTNAAVARAQQSSSLELPEFGIDAKYARIGPVPELTIPVAGNFKLYPEDNYDAHLSGRFTVFDFGKTRASVESAHSQVEYAKDAENLTKNNLGYQTIRLFYNILFLKKSLEVANEQIETLNQHLIISQKKVDAGTATNFDVLTTQVRVATMQNQKAELENSLHQQNAFMKQMLGLSEGSLLELSGDFSMLPVSLKTDSVVHAALDQRLDMKLARDSRKLAELQYNFASKGNYPSLLINGIWGIKNGYIPNLDILKGNWVTGAQLLIPLYDGNRAAYRQEEAQANIAGEEAHIANIELQIRYDVERAIEDIRTAVKRIDISHVLSNQANEAVVIAQKRYETGSGTNIDLLDAMTAASEAKLNSLQALYKYVLSKYELDQATGKLLY